MTQPDWENRKHFCSTCGEDCEDICKYSGEQAGRMWATDEHAAEARTRIPLLIVQRQHKERQRETLNWLITEAEGSGLWMWTPDRHDRSGWATFERLPPTEVSEIRDTLSKHSAGWYAPAQLRNELERHPEMHYWRWGVRRPEERVEWLAKSQKVIQEAIDKFSSGE